MESFLTIFFLPKEEKCNTIIRIRSSAGNNKRRLKESEGERRAEDQVDGIKEI